MNDSKTTVSTSTPTGLQIVRFQKTLITLLMSGVVIGALSSCSHDPDRPKKKRKPKHRDPVEQKVFYDGWWPKKDR